MSNGRRNTYSTAVFGFSQILRIMVYVLVVLFLFYCGKTAYTYGYQLFHETAMESKPGKDVEVTIPEGTGASGVASILHENGLIRNKRLFLLQERLSDYHNKEQAGTYTLNTSETPTEMLAILSGDTSYTSSGESSS
jgi:UPF0755 protein